MLVYTTDIPGALPYETFTDYILRKIKNFDDFSLSEQSNVITKIMRGYKLDISIHMDYIETVKKFLNDIIYLQNTIK